MFNSWSTSFYLSQVYNELNRQVMGAILAIVFSAFNFSDIYSQFVYMFIRIIDGFVWIDLTNQEIVDTSVITLSLIRNVFTKPGFL